jgi:hypothetical protein
MRLDSRIWWFIESIRWAVAEILILAIVLGGLWCLIVILTGLREKARRGNGRW